MEGATTTMAGLISMATPMLELIWSQVVAVAQMIVGDPLLFMTVVFLIAGGIVGIFGRVLSRS